MFFHEKFTINSVKLFEMPTELEDAYLNCNGSSSTHHLVIKGPASTSISKDDEGRVKNSVITLLTKDKTYRVRKVDNSNTLFLFDEPLSEDARRGKEECCATVDHTL